MKFIINSLYAVFIALYFCYSLLFVVRWDIMRVLGKKEKAEDYLHKKAKGWAKRVTMVTGSKVTITGQENIPDGPVLIVANHQSNFDIMTILFGIDKHLGFIAKKELRKVPFLSYWMKAIGCVFIDRGNPREGLKAISEGIEKLKAGHTLVVFPEGTRSKDGKLDEFKAGSFRLATKSGAPILPVAINGTGMVYEMNNHKISASHIVMQILPPINVAQMSKEELEKLPEITKQVIADALDDKGE